MYRKSEPPPRRGGGFQIFSQLAAAKSATSDNRQDFTVFQDQVRHLHSLGPAVLAEFLSETVDPIGLEIVLSRYARLSPTDPCRPSTRHSGGLRPLAEVTAEVAVHARLCCKARQLCTRPPRLTVEAVIALAKLRNDIDAAERILDSIPPIPDDVLVALDACDIPRSPIRVIADHGAHRS